MKRLKSILDVTVTLLVAIAAGVIIWRQFMPAGQLRARASVEDATGVISPELAKTVRGAGPVALIEFADFECPFCRAHVEDVQPEIVKAFIDTGVVRHVFLNNPLAIHPRAEQASAAALCAGNQGKFWEMRDALFENPSALQRSDLDDRALALGLNMPAFSRCIDGRDVYSVIERHKDAAKSLEIRLTPTFLVGIVQADGSVTLKKRINGAMPISDFHAAITEVAPREVKDRIRDLTLEARASVRTDSRSLNR